MIETETLDKLWKKVLYEFEDDIMMAELHFIREIMDILKRQFPSKSYEEIADMTRQMQIDWNKIKV